MKILFNISPDTEPLFEKIGACGNYSEKLLTIRVNKHTVRLFNIHTMFI